MAEHETVTKADVDSKVTTHEEKTTGVHGVGASTVCSETELATGIAAEAAARAAAITTHKGAASAHHTRFTETEAIVAAQSGLYTAGDIIVHSNPAEKVAVETTYTKKKETRLDVKPSASIRIKFDLLSEAVGQKVYGKIYWNGVAIGTQRRPTSADTYVTFTEDFDSSGWAANDLIQVFLYVISGYVGKVKNFDLCIGLKMLATSQDPD